MATKDSEEEQLRSVALQNAKSILLARRRAEEALSKQTEWLRITLSSIGDAVISTDAESKITFMNGVAESLTGWSQSEALRRPLNDVFHVIDEQTRSRMKNPALFALETGTIVGLPNHTILISRDGTEWPIDDSAAPIRNEQGEAAGVVLVFRDITQRRRSEMNIEFLAEISHDLASLANIDEIMKTVCARIGAHLELSLCAFIEINETAQEAVISHVWQRSSLRSLSGTYRIDDFVTGEFQQASRAGEVFVVRDTAADPRTVAEKYLQINVRSFVSIPLVRENQWKFVFVVADAEPRDWRPDQVDLIRELSARIWTWIERARALEALRSSEARFRAAVQAVSSLIWTNNAEGMMEGEQPGWESFTGQNYEDYQGFGWSRMVHPEDAQPTIDAWRQAVIEKRTFEFEHRLRRRDGEWRLCSIRAVPVLTGENVIREWVGVHTDITERRRDEEALKEADRRKNEFLAMLAHELRNPLAPIRNALEIVRRAQGNGATTQPAFEIMERQIGQMVRLVDDLLDVNRISQGKIELRSERVELAATINQAVETCRPTLDSAKHNLTVSLPDEPVYLYADPVRLAQAFSNLLSNACKYTEPGGSISVTADLVDGNVVVSVKDTGVGIPADMLQNVFEIFAQVDRSLERSQGGLGIGLTLVKDLVELHGGMVEARSGGPGYGSEFIVTLPVSAVENSSLRTTIENASQSTTETRRRILVVDDNQDSAESLVILLRSAGHEVYTAEDGLEAVESATALSPDVVLLDIGLPKLNGYEAARRIREQLGEKNIVLVALTGWGQEDDRRRAKEAGFDHHLTKPVEFGTLKRLIARSNTATG